MTQHPLNCDCGDCLARAPRYAGRHGAARALIEFREFIYETV